MTLNDILIFAAGFLLGFLCHRRKLICPEGIEDAKGFHCNRSLLDPVKPALTKAGEPDSINRQSK